MERISNRSNDSFESRIEFDRVEWCYEKKDGRWQILPLKQLPPFTHGDETKERQRRRDNFNKMYEETAAQ
jgi:hypothetical protein